MQIDNFTIVNLRRRRFLTTCAGVGITGLAGCTSDSSSDDDSGENDTTTDSSTGKSNQHDIDEPFTVGSGSKSIQYVVAEATLARSVGTSSISADADGLFLIVVLSMENVGDETIDITSRHLQVVDSEGREFDADSGASVYINQDPRFEAEGISFEQLQPGVQQRRVVVFDVATNESYALKIDPAGTFSGAETHYVALGNVPEP